MKKSWKDIGSVTRKRFDGSIIEFHSLKEAVFGLHEGQINDLKYGHLRERSFSEFFERYIWTGRGDEFVFLVDGVVIPVWKVKETYFNIPVSEHRAAYLAGCSGFARRWWYGMVDFKFRDGPVPGLRRRYRRYNRNANVQTTQEIRENDFIDHHDEEAREYGIKSRPNRRCLPTAWDDRPNGSYYQTNWKHFRKNQWIEKC